MLYLALLTPPSETRSFTTTISVATQAGCKDPSKDPSAKKAGKGFVNGLEDWCRTKRAGSVFFWLTLRKSDHNQCFSSSDLLHPVAWCGTAFLAFQEWRTGKTVYRREDPPFSLPSHHAPAPTDEEDIDPYTRRHNNNPPIAEEDEDDYAQGPFTDSNRYNGGGGGGGYNAAGRPSMDAYGAFSDPSPSGYARGQYDQPEVSRTMQYADPYAQVRASIHGGPGVQPPQYDNAYQR